jgi:two-component system, OmpR family, sensor histidine kinase CreC
VIAAVVVAALVDGLVGWSLFTRLARAHREGFSLRLRLFAALGGAAMVGALATGVYAVLVEPSAIGFAARLLSVAPKAFVLASGMFPALAFGTLKLGRVLAKPVEEITEVAVRVAQGESPGHGRPRGMEARRIGLALASLDREVRSRPMTAATLRDAWHDMKNPLAAVRASLELLEEGGLAPEDTARFLFNASAAAEELERQLEGLTTLGRFESGALHAPVSAPVGAIVRSVMERARPLAEARGTLLRVEHTSKKATRDRIPCDPGALARALANLVHNACVATPHGAVTITCDDTAPDSVVVDVANEPAAFPRAARERMFTRAASHTGTGLGLAIARAAVEAQGGSVTFMEWGPPRVRVRLQMPR